MNGEIEGAGKKDTVLGGTEENYGNLS